MFTPEQIEIIKKRLRERAPNLGNGCIACGANDWVIAPGFVNLNITESAETTVPGPRLIPGIAAMCDTCGNVHVFNLLSLDLHMDLGIDWDPESEDDPDG